MEFWGIEVKSGKSINVQPGEGNVIHLSQASLGEVKANKNEPVILSVTVDGSKLVLGTLLPEKLPQQLFDLVFDRDFELSHNAKSGSISFFGYKAANPVEEEEGFDSEDSDESEEEDLPIVKDNGKAVVKAKAEKPVVAEKAKENKDAAGKQKVKIVEPTKDEDDDEDDDSDEDGSSDGDLMDEDDSDDSEDEESDEDDDTPKKPSPLPKKRGPDSAIKTPGSQKKAKLVTPQKTDGKKSSGHVATPYPSKQAGKTPASKQSPKSGGSHSCGPCKKTFNSEVGLASHTKAKHSAGK